MSIKKKPSLAFRSPLWEHRDKIRRWRLERLTWREITYKLKADHGIELTLQAVRTFFKKASERDRQGKPPQLGFAPDPQPPREAAHASEAPLRSASHAKKEEATSHAAAPDPDTFFAERQKAIEKAKAEADKLKPYEDE